MILNARSVRGQPLSPTLAVRIQRLPEYINIGLDEKATSVKN